MFVWTIVRGCNQYLRLLIGPQYQCLQWTWRVAGSQVGKYFFAEMEVAQEMLFTWRMTLCMELQKNMAQE